MLVVHISNSMLAADTSPNRLEQARVFISKILHYFNTGTEVGLVEFAGTAYLRVPLTDDRTTLQQIINSLSPEDISAQGSNIELGLSTALDAMTEGNIVLLSDGESQTGSSKTSAIRAVEDHIPIYVIEFGTNDGAPIQSRRKTLSPI